MDMELSQYKVAQLDLDGDAEDVENREGDGYKVAISEGLDMKQKKDCKILTFKQNVPKAAEGTVYMLSIVVFNLFFFTSHPPLFITPTALSSTHD